MCGIFGYFCRSRVNMQKVLELLQHLETHKFKDETCPVGGHGAGVWFLDNAGNMAVHKVGERKPSPAKYLVFVKEISETSSRIVLGHVRRASDKFMHTVKYSEVTQPYKVNCLGLHEIVSTHNGLVKNYEAIKHKLKEDHHYESEKMGFVDSEVIPHLFEECLMHCDNEIEACKKTLETIKGNNTVVLLSMTKDSRLLHVLHKGHTRGMHVWKNDNEEIVLCSREDPVHKMFGRFLEEGSFERVLSIGWQVDSELQQTYDLVHT